MVPVVRFVVVPSLVVGVGVGFGVGVGVGVGGTMRNLCAMVTTMMMMMMMGR